MYELFWNKTLSAGSRKIPVHIEKSKNGGGQVSMPLILLFLVKEIKSIRKFYFVCLQESC